MEILTVLAVAVALGTDAFSMAVGVGMTGIRKKQILSISAVVSLFHIFMPLTGLSLGVLLGRAMGRVAAIIGSLVLVFIGFSMLWESLKPERAWLLPASRKRPGNRPETRIQVVSGFGGLLVLAGSVSLDALSVGFGLGTFRFNLLLTVLIMGGVAGSMTAAGFILGRRLGGWLGEKAQAAGGLILVFIGVKMFLG